MLRQTHIIYVYIRIVRFGNRHRFIPETEMVDTVRALSYRKKRFAVVSLYPHDQNIFAVPLDRSRIQRGIDTDTLHHIRISLRIQVVTPMQRDVSGGHDRMNVTVVNAVTELLLFIFKVQQSVVLLFQRFEPRVVTSHIFLSFFISTHFPIYIPKRDGTAYPQNRSTEG